MSGQVINEDVFLKGVESVNGNSLPVQTVYSLLNYWHTVGRLVVDGPAPGEEPLSAQKVVKGDSEELTTFINFESQKAMRNILDNLESGLADHEALFRILRPKILRACNDLVRNIIKEIEDYHVLRVKESTTEIIFKAKEGQ